ncbi:hypothetical protein lbkm_3977 [Lachnospiraceae bacterium KM106-2]|nr:hypothetical protein lbkm_3977 [Lachnospiraceae bacterium KM106-2]
MKTCKNCGAVINAGDNFCINCGTKVEKADHKKMAIILGICAVFVICIWMKLTETPAYEKPFVNLKSAINTRNAEKFKECFMPELISDSDIGMISDEDLEDEFEDVKVLSIKVTKQSGYTKSDLEEAVYECRDQFYVNASDIDEFAVVDMEMKVRANGEVDSKTQRDIILLKKKGKWYLTSYNLFN